MHFQVKNALKIFFLFININFVIVVADLRAKRHE